MAYSPSCRVRQLNPPVQTQNGQIQRGHATWASQGSVFTREGMTVTGFNVGLRIPQRTDYLTPEFFNGNACLVPFAANGGDAVGPYAIDVGSPTSAAMLNESFSSMNPHTGNDAPPSISFDTSYNSVAGWQFIQKPGASGEASITPMLRWQS